MRTPLAGAYRRVLVSASRAMPADGLGGRRPAGRRRSTCTMTCWPSSRKPSASSASRSATGPGRSSGSRRSATSRCSAASVSRPVRAANSRASATRSGRVPPRRCAAEAMTTIEVRWWAVTSCSSRARRWRSVSAARARRSSASASRPAAAPRSACQRCRARPNATTAGYTTRTIAHFGRVVLGRRRSWRAAARIATAPPPAVTPSVDPLRAQHGHAVERHQVGEREDQERVGGNTQRAHGQRRGHDPEGHQRGRAPPQQCHRDDDRGASPRSRRPAPTAGRRWPAGCPARSPAGRQRGRTAVTNPECAP